MEIEREQEAGNAKDNVLDQSETNPLQPRGPASSLSVFSLYVLHVSVFSVVQ